MKNYLINEDLFRENVKDYENLDLDYKRSPDTVGIKSEISKDGGKLCAGRQAAGGPGLGDG